MTERIGDLGRARVEAAVSDEHPFAVPDVALLAGEVEVGGGVLKSHGTVSVNRPDGLTAPVRTSATADPMA